MNNEVKIHSIRLRNFFIFWSAKNIVNRDALSLSSCSPSAFKQNLEVSDSANQFIEQIDSIVVHKMNQYNIPGLAIGIVQNNAIYHVKGFGLKEIKSNKLVNENTIFHTASISKLFTALAVMDLVDQNLISLEDKMVDILSGLHYSDDNVKAITIKNLLRDSV